MSNKVDSFLEIFSGYVPLRHQYYRMFYGHIVKKINQKTDIGTQEKNLKSTLSDFVNIQFDNFEKVSNVEKQKIIKRADEILNNKFDYLGSGLCVLNPIPWNSDFKVNYEWAPGTYYKKYVQVDLSNNADVKVPRELSRCHFLLHLALAYKFTSDFRYAERVIDLILDWIKQNPFLYSINWCCSMDVAIRAINWIWALSIIDDYQFGTEKVATIRTSLYEHGWYIYRNLEGSILSYNGNHYMSDIVGLLHLGYFFSKDSEGKKWKAFAKKELFREIRLQILPSGMQYEGSTHYHRLVTELILPALTILKNKNEVVPPDIEFRFESMFDFVRNTLPSNGLMPIIGDQDNGRCLPFGTEGINDMRYLMSISDILFNNYHSQENNYDYNIYCAIFEKSNIIGDSCQSKDCKYLSDAGISIVRKKEWYVLFNIDNQGLYRDKFNGCGHTHSDWLSFVLNFGEIPLIVDPGTYVYSSDPDSRNLFRSTLMHNTLVVDNKNQTKIPKLELWSLPRKGYSKLIDINSDSSQASVTGESSAYSLEGEQILHRRRINVLDSSVHIIDTVTGINKCHELKFSFHFNNDVSLDIYDNKVSILVCEQRFMMSFITTSKFEICKESFPLSDSYGSRKSSTKIGVIINSSQSVTFETKIEVI